MEICDLFDELAYDIKACPLSRMTKSEMIQLTFWLKRQSLCDSDRKASDFEIQKVWAHLDGLMKHWGVYDRTNRPDQYWERVHGSVHPARVALRPKSRASQKNLSRLRI